MSSRFSTWLVGWLLAGTIGSLAGCGGGDSGTQVASNAPALPTPVAAGVGESSEPEQEAPKAPEKPQSSYAGESTSANAGASGSGGDSGGMRGGSGGDSGGMMAGSDEEMSGMGMGGPGDSGGMPGLSMAGPGVSMAGPGMSAPGSEMNSRAGMSGPGMTSGPGEEEESMGGMGRGMGGMGGGFPGGPGMQSDSGLVSSFIRQSCLNCHGGNNAKGGVRLDRINQDIASAPNEWRGVVEALESGSMPPRNSQPVNPQAKAKVIAFIREALSSTAESTFMERAELAFKKGDIEKAKQLFYAQLVSAEESEVTELANHFKLYRPTVTNPDHLTPTNESGVAVKPKLTTNLQLGVGIILKLTGQVTDVKPIGVSQAGGAGGGSGEMGEAAMGMRGGAGGGRGGANQNVNTKLETFEDLTGDVGRSLVSAFQGRAGSGNYGTLFSAVSDGSEDTLAQAGMGNAGGGFGSGGPDSGDGGMGAGMGEAGMDGPGLAGGPGMGGPGMGGPGMGGMGGGMAGGTGGSAKTKAGGKLANGLVYIGKADNLNNLIKKSADAGVDGVIVIEIEASKNLRNIVTNETRLKFMLPSGKIAAAASKTLNNVEVERALAMGKEVEDVQKQVDVLFGHLDRILKLSDMPQISAATALKQLHTRIHSDTDRLQILAEARMYNAKGIISTEQLEMVYQVVFEGNEGTTLASGSSDDRKLVLTAFTEKL